MFGVSDVRTPRDIANRLSDHRHRDADDGYVRERFTLPRAEAREKAAAYFRRYPSPAYMTAVDAWRALPGDEIEFTMRRLRTAD